MTIAITAASGQLGSEIVKATIALLSKEHVIGLARTPDKAADLGIEIRPGDYTQKDVLERSLQSVNTLLLVSGMDAPEKRIEQHRNVIQAARNSGVTKIVYTSVQGADDNTAFSPVIQSNRQTEQDVSSSGLESVIGRNGIYSEPDVEYIESYKKQGGGEFMGSVIAGIYQGIRDGSADNPSDYFEAAGREHESWQAYFERLKLNG